MRADCKYNIPIDSTFETGGLMSPKNVAWQHALNVNN